MVGTEAIATVVRVTRPNTVIIRTLVPHVQSMLSTYLVLEGVKCRAEAKQAIADWVEIHADAGRLRLHHVDWFRDSYGRLMGDLIDLQTGESLTGYLLEQGYAQPRPGHYADIIESMLRSVEPEEL
jgi:hypothetical protein